MDEGRFPPGTLLAKRYRIVSLLGRGGMGEVYRANDLLLGQTVALKFLPAQWTSHEATLVRFRNEVRIARQISPRCCGASGGCHRTRRWRSPASSARGWPLRTIKA